MYETESCDFTIPKNSLFSGIVKKKTIIHMFFMKISTYLFIENNDSLIILFENLVFCLLHQIILIIKVNFKCLINLKSILSYNTLQV